ncbi:YihY/virulence factor BrkB family protein [Blastococcus sp. VKM Ac-2987]|uniref:YihY/virulence factor BrkB family protein n=1 Tax=Blastococcus sp. VKM Ac-2987 TaxID=3004141 RepID=UPI0022ABA7CA|nr:YihY/virulence factor BrkB family protein [Blastococcus sp. VKM Ac-2987]MCZ2857151.1 YihY/virulence factor BrkB family protein [Blastococcus sp. VKM Ac-2987]
MTGTRPRESAVDRIRQRVEEKAARRAAAAQTTADGGPPGNANRLPPGAPAPEQLPGIDADSPTQIPARGWKQVLKRAWAENNADNMPIIAGGVAFFGFLAIFPALIALISIYGLIVSPEQAATQVEELTTGLPEDARTLIQTQVTNIADAGGALTWGLVLSTFGALFSASGGVNNLVKAVNIAYDEVETRNFIKLRALSLVLTLGAIVFVVLTIGLIAVLPVVIDVLPLGSVGTVLAEIGRWVALLAVVAGSLAVLYRVAPDRDAPRFRWVSLGSVLVTVVWAVVSLGFTFYVNNFGSYDATYGAIAGVIVLMLWLYLTCYLVLLGAEINSEAEHQTGHDTTDGEPMPMGERDAVKADTLPAKAEPEKGDSDPTRKAAP